MTTQLKAEVDLVPELEGWKQLGLPGKIYDIKGSFPKPDFTNWVNHTTAVFGVSCNNSIDTWIQINGEGTNEVLDLVADLSTKGLSGPTLPLRIGSPVLACWPEDKSWYRARITKINGAKYTVLFVDYGNEETLTLDDLRDCPKEVIDCVEGATCCYLNGFTGLEVPDELHVLKSAIEEQDLIARIDALGVEIRGKTRMKVSIFDRRGRTLADTVQQYVREQRLIKGLPVKPIVTTIPAALPKLMPVTKPMTNGVDAIDGLTTIPRVPRVIKIGEAPKLNTVISTPVPTKAVDQLVMKTPVVVNSQCNNSTSSKQDIGTSTSSSTTNYQQLQVSNKEIESLRLRLKERDQALSDITNSFAKITTFYQKQIKELQEELDEVKNKAK